MLRTRRSRIVLLFGVAATVAAMSYEADDIFYSSVPLNYTTIIEDDRIDMRSPTGRMILDFGFGRAVGCGRRSIIYRSAHLCDLAPLDDEEFETRAVFFKFLTDEHHRRIWRKRLEGTAFALALSIGATVALLVAWIVGARLMRWVSAGEAV